ncbi:MAG: protease complex subunit PrcB family protein [Pseudomonadota bacterium]
MMAAQRRHGTRLATLLLVAGLMACRPAIPPASGTDTRAVTTLATGTQCAPSAPAPAARWLDTPASLQSAYRDMTRHSLGANTLPAPVPDFAAYGVLQVFMGQQPTGGYQLRLLRPNLELHATAATVRIEWLSPPPGAILPQLVTSPCLLLAVPRGAYHTLTVTDQAGRIRANAAL